ncbi:MAG: ABC transporter permease [Clostridia bacterium]|nr:ABC transporter permease [Clostridia bacterium]
MNLKHIWTIFKKEVKDITRDKKTIITSIVVPIIIFPVIYGLVGGGVEKLQKDINENVTIGLSENSRTEEVKSMVKSKIIKEYPNIKLIDNIGDSVEAVRNEKVRVVLDFDKDYAQKLKDKKPFTIRLMYDKSKTKSEGSVGIVNEAIQKFNMGMVAERISALGVSTDILQPSNIEHKNVADTKKGGNPMLGMLIPMLLVSFIATGGIPAATDLIAGEKERNTFEPLLTTRPKRISILIGKFLTVNLFAFMTVLASLTGLIISYILNPNSLTMGVGDNVTGFDLPVPAVLLTLCIAILLGFIFTGIQIALSTYAKSFKEAQTYLGLLIIVVLIPAYTTMFMQANDIPVYMFLVPILNTISAIKMVLGGVIIYSKLILAVGSSIVYMIATTSLAAWMFTREKVLFRS